MRAMKDSGIDWIGQIPEHWAVWRMKRLASEPLQYGANATGVEFREDIPRYIRITDISADRKLNAEGKQSLEMDTAQEYMLEDGDILFARSGATSGKSFYYEAAYGSCCFAGYLIRLRTKNTKALSKFLYYYTLTQAYENWTQQIFIQATIQNISADKYNNLRFAVPESLEEQEAIVAYLDQRCSEIDALIAAKEKTNALLKERRQSIIYETVTKGLNPNVPMKDSQVFWIGHIPCHWDVTRLKFYATIRTGFTLGKRYDASEELQEYPYLRVANVQGEYTDLSNVTTIYMPASEAEQFKLHAGELLMTEGGDRDKLGRGSVWHGEIPDCLHQNHVFALATKEQLNVEYLSYLTTSSVGRDYFDFTAKKTTNLASTNATTILEFKIPFPSREEQDQIVAFLNRECGAIDELITRNDATIAALKEYRQSVIYEAVTGKIEV